MIALPRENSARHDRVTKGSHIPKYVYWACKISNQLINLYQFLQSRSFKPSDTEPGREPAVPAVPGPQVHAGVPGRQGARQTDNIPGHLQHPSGRAAGVCVQDETPGHPQALQQPGKAGKLHVENRGRITRIRFGISRTIDATETFH